MEIIGSVFFYAMIFVVAAIVIGILGCIVMTIAASRGVTLRMKRARRRIEEILPGTDCGKCGYGTCREYAQAAVSGTEEYRKCESCSDGFNSRISFMWAKPKEEKDETED